MVKIVGIVVLVVAVLGGAFFFMRPNDESSDSSVRQGTSEVTMNDDESGSFSGSITDLLALGKNYTCTFDVTDEAGNQTSGTVYMAGGSEKMSGDFNFVQSDSTTMTGGMVRDGQKQYVWTSQSEQGYVTDISDLEVASGPSSDKKESDFIDLNNNADFDCSPWRVDESMFTPPSNIEFVDISAQMEVMMENQADVDGVDCSLCDSVPAGAAKDQCLTSLGCN